MPDSAIPRTLPMVKGGLFGVFFLLGMSPGYYVPALSNILAGPVASLVSPLIPE